MHQLNPEHSSNKIEEFCVRIGNAYYGIKLKPTKQSLSFPTPEKPSKAHNQVSHFTVDYCGKKKRIYFSGDGKGGFYTYIKLDEDLVKIDFLIKV